MRRLLIGAVLASASALWPFSSSEKQDPPTPHPDAVPVAQQTALRGSQITTLSMKPSPRAARWSTRAILF